MKDLVNVCLSSTSLSHLAARESGKRVLLAESTVARKAVSGSIISVIILVLFSLVLFCETGLLCVVLATLELTMKTILASNSQRSFCLCFPSSVLSSMHHHAQQALFLRTQE